MEPSKASRDLGNQDSDNQQTTRSQNRRDTWKGRRDRVKSSPTKVSEILDDALDMMGLRRGIAERAVLDAWPEIVGEKIAKHTRAVDCRDGVVFVAADHGAWRQELLLLAPVVVEKYNQAFGEGTVRDIQWSGSPTHHKKRKKKA